MGYGDRVASRDFIASRGSMGCGDLTFEWAAARADALTSAGSVACVCRQQDSPVVEGSTTHVVFVSMSVLLMIRLTGRMGAIVT